jgi:hypothetical protein
LQSLYSNSNLGNKLGRTDEGTQYYVGKQIRMRRKGVTSE